MNILTYNMFRFNEHSNIQHVQTLLLQIWYNWATQADVLVLYIVHLSLHGTLNFVGVVDEVVSMTTRELLCTAALAHDTLHDVLKKLQMMMNRKYGVNF